MPIEPRKVSKMSYMKRLDFGMMNWMIARLRWFVSALFNIV